ncbi:hypothetical protein F183_A28760 [Bryobacterales bacterium F-183]|nr:hypothetical protein F183_A28760 [Bryobacterales bacterium F-183]
MKHIVGCSLSLLAQWVLHSQTAVKNPESGWIFDKESSSIRAIRGTPGAATLGLPVSNDVELAYPSRDGNRGIVVRKRAVGWTHLQEESFTALPVGTADLGLVSWSRHEATAAVHNLQSHMVLLVSDVSDGLKVRTLALPEGTVVAIGGPVGDGVFVAIRGGSLPGLYRLNDGATPQLLIAHDNLAAIAVTAEDDAVFALSQDGRRLWIVEELAGTSAVQSLTVDVPPAVVGLGVSANRGSLYVAHADSRSLSVVSPADGSLIGTLPLDVPVSGMVPLGHDSNYILTTPGGDAAPHWLLQTSSSSIFFVPAAR